MPDIPISQLPLLSGTGLAADDSLPLADVSASETKQITAKDLVQSGIQLIDAGSIPGDKINGTSVPAGSIGTTELANGSVTAAKLADQSSALYTTPLPAAGSFIGQLAVDSSDDKAYFWSGSSWDPLRGVTEAGASFIFPLYLQASLGQDAGGNINELTVSGYLQPTTGANQFLAGPTSSAGSVDYLSPIPI